ncbi:MAG: TIGR00730 family Rossman fold protein [Muribaculaceae bacterium]|nr:TIGR00730 family Rossman fold protein [Muribaculaceae bacterium]
MLKVAVYCSSFDRLPEHWQEGARITGRWIGHNKGQLIYGGIGSGLMAVVARAAKDSGAEVVGIVPSRLRCRASALNDTLVPASDLNDRKGVMQMLGDVFVVLPGGYGTLDEFTTSFSYLNFTNSRRPIIVYNPDGVFDCILEQFRRSADLGLMKPECLEIISVATTPEQLAAALEAATPSDSMS